MQFKTSVFKIVEWIDKNEKQEYLFVGTKYKKQIEELKNNKISSENIETLKNHFSNFKLLKKTLEKNKDITIINETINTDDTIFTLKNKIAMYIDEINYEHIYTWITKDINNYEFLDILNNIFNKVDKLPYDDINNILKKILLLEFDGNKNKNYTLNDIYNIFENSTKTINIPLEIRYFDNNNNQEFILSNPYKNKNLDKNFITDDGKYKPKEFKLDNLSILKSKIDNNIINFTNSNNILEYIKDKVKKQNKTDEEIFNGLIKVYFPKFKDIEELDKIDDFNESIKKIIKNDDKIINNIYNNSTILDINSKEEFINKLHIRIYPVLVNNKYTNLKFNLESIFNKFKTDEDYPIITYNKKNNNLYKINKDSLGKKTKENLKKIDNNVLNNITKDKNTIRPIEFLVFTIYFHEIKESSKYFTFLFFENGQIDIIFNFKITDNVRFEQIIKSFTKINKLIELINNEFNIKLIEINDTILNNKSDLSFIEYREFSVSNNINFNRQLNSNSDIKKSLEYSYPFFEIIKKKNQDNNLFSLKYKRTNNFYNNNKIINLIIKNIDLERNEIIDKISDEFEVSNNEAIKMYDDNIEYTNLNIVNNNRFVISKANSVLIDLNLNINEIKILTDGLNNININDKINHLLINIISNKYVIKDKSSKKNNNELFNKLLKSKVKENKKNQDDLDSIKTNSNSFNEFADSNNNNNDDNSNPNLKNNNLDSSKSFNEFANSNNNNNSNDKPNNDKDKPNNDKDKPNNDKDKPNNDKDDDNNVNNLISNINKDIDNTILTKDDDDNVDKDKDDDNLLEDLTKIDILNPTDKKKYHTRILKRLKDFDNELFGFGIKSGHGTYSRKCQSYKQPIVITKEEKEIIDKNYPKSYAKAVKGIGSTAEKRENYYYICPKIWCPTSKVSMTQEQYDDKKCPNKELPIIITHNSWKKKNPETGEIEDIILRYPNLLSKDLHPKKLSMPCCGTKDEKKKIKINKITKKYIVKDISLPAPVDRYAMLPIKLSNIIGNINCNDLANKSTNCFVRKGIESNEQYFISTLIYLMNNDKVKDLEDFNKVIEDNMSPLDYIELNNGNTLKLYLNDSISIYDNKTFKNFKKWFITQEKYIEKMNLNNLKNEIKNLDEFKYEDNNNYNNAILREFMIYNSFTNFKIYLRTNLTKSHEDVLQIFANNYEWLNPNNYNIILLNSTKSDKIKLLCSKFINYKDKTNFVNKFVFVLKSNGIYEPIVKIIGNDMVESNNFDYFEDSEFKNIIDLQKEKSNISNLKEYIDPILLFKELKELGQKIKFVVIDMSFKLSGYLLKNNLFIPVDSNIFSSNILRDTDIDLNKLKYIYIEDLVNYKCKLELNKINDLFQILNTELNTNYYPTAENNELIKNKQKIVAIKLNNNIIPLDINNEDKKIIKDLLNNEIDETIFLGSENKNDVNSYINDIVKREKDYNNKLKDIVKKIMTDTTKYENIEYLKHKFNPLPDNIKFDKIKQILNSLNIEIDEDKIDEIVYDIYIKDLNYILKKNNSKLEIQTNEIVLNQEDIQNNKLIKLSQKLINPYKTIENSIEDYINYIPISISKTTNNKTFKFLTDTFNIIPKKWADSLSFFEINTRDNSKNTTEYLLNIFVKTSILLKNKGLNEKKLKDKINKLRIESFNEDKDEFIREFQMNKYFETNLLKLGLDSEVDAYSQIEQIFDDNYKYSFYEIKKLSELVKINTIILTKENTGILPNSIKCIYTGSDKYLLLYLNVNTEDYDDFNLIVKNINKFIFEEEDFKNKFKEIIKKYCSKSFIKKD